MSLCKGCGTSSLSVKYPSCTSFLFITDSLIDSIFSFLLSPISVLLLAFPALLYW